MKSPALALGAILIAVAAAGAGYFAARWGDAGPAPAVPAPALVVSGPELPPEKLVAAVKDKIANMLNDPESVRWRDVRAVSATEVCGELNARNAMGGYVGFTPFVGWIDSLAQVEVMVVQRPTGYGFDAQGRQQAEDALQRMIDQYLQACGPLRR